MSITRHFTAEFDIVPVAPGNPNILGMAVQLDGITLETFASETLARLAVEEGKLDKYLSFEDLE